MSPTTATELDHDLVERAQRLLRRNKRLAALITAEQAVALIEDALNDPRIQFFIDESND